MNYKWIFNLKEFEKQQIFIHCETNDEALKLLKFFKELKLQWYTHTEINLQEDIWESCPLYSYTNLDNIDVGISRGSLNEFYNEEYGENLTLYKFSEINFNGENEFDITKERYITREQLDLRGHKTGDILFDGYSMAIVYGNKVLHINNKCVETLNSKAFDYILPIELIESDSEIQRLLSGKLSGKISQAYLEDLFIRIEEPPKLKTICSVKFTVSADCPKEFILEDDSEVIAVNDIVEANTGGKNYQYAKVVEVNTLELSEHEINNYRTCRILSL